MVCKFCVHHRVLKPRLTTMIIRPLILILRLIIENRPCETININSISNISSNSGRTCACTSIADRRHFDVCLVPGTVAAAAAAVFSVGVAMLQV